MLSPEINELLGVIEILKQELIALQQRQDNNYELLNDRIDLILEKFNNA